MWIISKEGLIVIGVVAVLGIIGLVLLLQPARPLVAPAPAQTVASPQLAPAAPPAAIVPSTPVPPVAIAPTTAEATPAVTPPATTFAPVTAIDGVIYAGEYAHSTEAAGFEIHWSNDAQTLRVGLISPG